ncbi:hypothetical protein F2Q69_00029307 [Brassica cretica]|uniref:Uncharacterized protein n=1 Tax=Brassica cretica TaxID=69181 RepID=A0A8S9S4B5_BRACR|nr:hypothetical protein F2Q69_00029307 [Brassica cretica]
MYAPRSGWQIQLLLFQISLEDAPARFTGAFFGSRSPSSSCGCRWSGFNKPGELETPVVEGSGMRRLLRRLPGSLLQSLTLWKTSNEDLGRLEDFQEVFYEVLHSGRLPGSLLRSLRLWKISRTSSE